MAGTIKATRIKKAIKKSALSSQAAPTSLQVPGFLSDILENCIILQLAVHVEELKDYIGMYKFTCAVTENRY